MNTKLTFSLNQIGLPIIILLMALGCQTEKGLKISGTYGDPMDDKYAFLELIQNDQLEVVDSFKIEPSGKFELFVKVEEPSFYRLNFYDRDIVNMILNDVDVTIVNEKDVTGRPYYVKGSPESDQMYALQKTKIDFEQEAQRINRQFMNARGAGNEDKMQELEDEYYALKAKTDKNVKDQIWAMDNSITGILAIAFLDEANEFPFIDSLATKYQKQLPNSVYTKNLVEKVETLRKLAIGSAAPEINLPDPNGNMISLSSFKGKYVLIDFWAAWCGPCRQENPNVVRLYNAYADKGFDILGVSLDRKKEAWVKAIEDDGLIWNHVSDLKYFGSEAADLYNIQAIPATFLIDPDGKIIGKNLRGPSLEAKLKEIFG